MKSRLRFFGLLSLFWLAFFILGRVLFFIYLYPQTATLSISEILLPFVYGFRMDAAMTGYWMIITGLLFTASPFISNRALVIIQGIFTILFIILSTLIVVADIELY